MQNLQPSTGPRPLPPRPKRYLFGIRVHPVTLIVGAILLVAIAVFIAVGISRGGMPGMNPFSSAFE